MLYPLYMVKNPQDSEPLSYVFKKGVIVGELSNKGTVVPFSFPKDTVVVPDYGDQFTTQQAFLAEVTELIKCGELYPHEYENLIYTLYKSKKTKRKYKRIFEEILKNIIP